MEVGGGPDGSEASYESVASEGGYEPAAERGRDPLPRIISSSSCVEIFRRVRWVDGAFCSRARSKTSNHAGGDKVKSKSSNGQARFDPLEGLPQRLMRFEGAMEAWLEEMPGARDPHRLLPPRPYSTLNDAATVSRPGKPELSILRSGNQRATIWYFNLDFLQQLWPLFLQSDNSAAVDGVSFWASALRQRGCTIMSTHLEVGRVHCDRLVADPKSGKARGTWLKALFSAMQASNWSPDGEARSLQVKRKLTHTSMSIGDAVQVGKKLYVVGVTGFVAVGEATSLLPRVDDDDDAESDDIEVDMSIEVSDEDSALEDDDDDEESIVAPTKQAPTSPNNSELSKGAKKKNNKKKNKKGGDDGDEVPEKQQQQQQQQPPQQGGGQPPTTNGKSKGKGKGKGGAPQRVDRRALRAKLQANRERLER